MDYHIQTDNSLHYFREFREMIEASLRKEGFIGLVGGTSYSKADVLSKIETYRILIQDTARIILCAKNSVEWVCIFCAAVLDQKELFILDAHIDRQKLCNLAASVRADLVITDDEADFREPAFCPIGQLPFRSPAGEAVTGTGKIIL